MTTVLHEYVPNILMLWNNRFRHSGLTPVTQSTSHPCLFLSWSPGHMMISNYLLNYFPGLDIERRNCHGFTALMKAAMQGRAECVRALMMAGRMQTFENLIFGRSYFRNMGDGPLLSTSVCALHVIHSLPNAEYCSRADNSYTISSQGVVFKRGTTGAAWHPGSGLCLLGDTRQPTWCSIWCQGPVQSRSVTPSPWSGPCWRLKTQTALTPKKCCHFIHPRTA